MTTEALPTKGSAVLEPDLTATAVRTADPVRRRIAFGGVLVDQVDLAGAVARVRELVRAGGPHHVVTVNLDFLSIAGADDQFRGTLNLADLAVADGMPLVWLSRLTARPLPERVAGVELFTECCALAAEEGRSVFLLGAGPGVADAAAARLQELCSGLRIAGTYAPPKGPMTARENDRIVATIRAAQPDFLFVALGAPRQDLWIRQNKQRLNVPVAMGVGCVFDLLAGQVNRAPGWMRGAGLEWAFRLCQEPGRLWRRYLVNDLPLFARLAVATFGRKQERSLAVPT
jgi:N-acetylglucosaminyldiphosphoundecaprenol N-acetyl-beta-D-mannosaminyltransferase